MVDDSDYDLVSQFIWSLTTWRGKEYAKRREAVTSGKYPEYQTVSMHGYLTGYKECDHIDGNGLNNQRSNLRSVTHQQNIAAQRPQSRPKSSAYRGVCWFKPRSKWRARLKNNGIEVHIGYFDSEHEAARAWNKVAVSLWGEYAFQNKISEDRR